MQQKPGQLALDAVADLRRAFRASGTYGALRFLNARTRHRYTGAYLFDPPRLVNYCLFDRDNPEVRCQADLVLRDSYCAIVAGNGDGFTTDDALRDERLRSHPNRTLTLAYHGYALCDANGECIGSLCHWDARPRMLAASELPLLRAAAALISREIQDRRSERLTVSATRWTAPEGLRAR